MVNAAVVEPSLQLRRSWRAAAEGKPDVSRRSDRRRTLQQWVITFGIALLAATASWPAETFDARPLVFKNVFASKPGDRSTTFSLVGTGMFRAPRADDLDGFVGSWMRKHPHAVATVVDQMRSGPKLGQMVYIWVDDGNDSLNVDLVRQGVVPGGMMADAVEYLNSIKDAAHFDMNSPDAPRRIVTDDAYSSFMKKIAAAELAARAEKVGLWSDKYRQMMEDEGFLPGQGDK